MRPTASVLVGDVRAVLATLEDESVSLVMTSPPYWNLRDYGTGRWEGGSADCKHVKSKLTLRSGLAEAANACDGGKRTAAGRKDQEVNISYRDTCAKCGAVRIDQQIGLESALDCCSWATGADPCRACWICAMRDTFAEVRRVLRRDGVCWVNVGDSYSCTPNGRSAADTKAAGNDGRTFRDKPNCGLSVPQKNLMLAPQRLTLALQQDGWFVRSVCQWVKRSSMPQSVTDRPSTSLEWMIMLTRSAHYHWDQEAVRRDMTRGTAGSSFLDGKTGVNGNGRNGHGPRTDNPAGRNLRDSDWWFDSVGMLLRDEVLGFDVVSEPSSDQHYASYPRRLVRDVVLAGSSGAGVCGECGAPWVRVVARTKEPDLAAKGSRFDVGKTGTNGNGRVQEGERYQKQPIGFRPSCTHAAPRVPATILDPFCGRATTLVVALEYGRNAIGIELSAEYAAMARRRLAAVECQPLLDVTAPAQAQRAEQMAMEVEE